MNLEYFPNFMRMNYPEINDATADEIKEIGIEFKKYLEHTFQHNMDKLTEIWAIEPKDIIPNIGHPFRTNGYHPALIIHFGNFAKEMAQQKPDDQ